MIAILDTPSPRTRNQLTEVPKWFDRWEQILSRFRRDGELDQLNRSIGTIRPVSPVLWQVFQLSLDIAGRSMGLASPLVLDALLQARYEQSFETLNPSGNGNISKPNLPIPGVDALYWDSQSHSIRLDPDTRLDFGRVAKGWAAHTAMKKLENDTSVLIDAGGDIAISGLRRDGQPWPVAIADPHRPGEQLVLLKAGNCGIATLGTDYRRRKMGDRWENHIIDPCTGRPAQTDVPSVTAVEPTVIDAEMAAKAVLILGSRQGLEWLNNQTNMEGLLVLEDGRLIESKNFNKHLWE